ncbi:hypothetical protein HYH03_011990 [Edaphochlamys debaryana]|uniref:Radical SAM core domain-containing protein n=1 Tax=Edaphochlamys debaryana TaxID=47281 RepID=A0A835XTN2_9CHLO|nr:hypothetical protein HYH03_011990 [Edaphochlamys debaryana]|eukprot:KAG2489539.1 hypothetical protein HYH03_011990 [Edaphochlamys debaryana]
MLGGLTRCPGAEAPGAQYSVATTAVRRASARALARGSALRQPQGPAPRTWVLAAPAVAPAAPLPSTAADSAAAPHLPWASGEEQQPEAWVPPRNRPGLYDSAGRLVLKSLTLPELEAWCAAEGEPAPANRALQLWRWMYADPPVATPTEGWAASLQETAGRQNGFSAKFIEKASPRMTLAGGLELKQVVSAADGTRKLVFTLTEGEAKGGSVETVLIPVVRQAGLRDRLTICVSSQVGCAMNCQFCFTGRMGLLGSLSAAQIVEQVVAARRFLAAEGDRTPLTNLVFMGMGEPLHNTEAVLTAAEIMNHHLGLHLSYNKITISTVGLVPEMRQVAARSRVQMALSLHATTDEVRDWIVPVNRRYDLATLTAALEEIFPRKEGPRTPPAPTHAPADCAEPSASSPSASSTSAPSTSSAAGEPQRWLPPLERLAPAPSTSPSSPPSTSAAASSTPSTAAGPGPVGGWEPGSGGRSLLVEYTMLYGVNDTQEDARRLASMLSRVNCKVNLICFNPHAGTRFRPSTDEAICAFRSVLIQSGLVCTIRDSRGDDEMAACGQLGAVGLPFRPSPILEPPERFRPFLLPEAKA